MIRLDGEPARTETAPSAARRKRGLTDRSPTALRRPTAEQRNRTNAGSGLGIKRIIDQTRNLCHRSRRHSTAMFAARGVAHGAGETKPGDLTPQAM